MRLQTMTDFLVIAKGTHVTVKIKEDDIGVLRIGIRSQSPDDIYDFMSVLQRDRPAGQIQYFRFLKWWECRFKSFVFISAKEK